MLDFGAGDESGGGAGNGVTIVTLECAGALTLSIAAALNPLFICNHTHQGVLPCGTAVEVVQHIEKTWTRGQAAVQALRDELEVGERDNLCPLVQGEVSLHKIYGVMHDTCNTANLVAELILQLQERKKKRLPYRRGTRTNTVPLS